MKNIFIGVTFLLISPILCWADTLNISIDDNGKIEQIHYENISKDHITKILAQLVADDIMKYAAKLASNNRNYEAYLVSSSITYLDQTNTNALRKSVGYMKKIIFNESDREKVFKDLINDAKSSVKNSNSIHKIQEDMALVLAEEARELYPKESPNYKIADGFITRHSKLSSRNTIPSEAVKKIEKQADSALKSGDNIKAINKYSILYYASKDPSPLVQITKILKSEN